MEMISIINNAGGYGRVSTPITLDTAPPLTRRKFSPLEGVNVLTGQKRKFAQALMSGSSQAEAARKAGYSEKTARSQGSRLAKDPDIIAFISKKRGAEVIAEQAVSEPDDLPKVVNRTVKEFDDPLEFLKSVMNDVSEETDVRKDAAKAMLPYLHPKKGEGGKKDARHAAAKVAATGSKFGAMAPPKLVVNNKG